MGKEIKFSKRGDVSLTGNVSFGGNVPFLNISGRMLMQVRQKVKNDVVVCYLAGEVNIDTVSDLKKVFKELIEANHRKILLNFSDVEYMDSAGLASLIDLSKSLKNIQGIVFLCSLSPKLMSVFGITRLDKMFKIYETENEALQDFYGY